MRFAKTLLLGISFAASCTPKGGDLEQTLDAAAGTATSDVSEAAAARGKVRNLATRFRVRIPAASDAEDGVSAAMVAPVNAVFANTAGRLTPRLVDGVAPRAQVSLPSDGAGRTELADEKLSLSFTLAGAKPTPAAVGDGVVVYEGAGPEGADVLHRVSRWGTEDFLVFEHAPRRAEIVYRLDVSRAAGLRLIDGTLELLDASGDPRLRMSAPWIVDVRGTRKDVKVDLVGCAADRDPRAPWGRPVTPPGAAECLVHLAWGADVAYPALLDPTWSTTASMTKVRAFHTAEKLVNGRVLIVGGQTSDTAYEASAELYNHDALAINRTFAATGSLPSNVARSRHTSTRLANGQVLVTGGLNQTGSIAQAATYDTGGGTWTATSGPLTELRARHTATLLADGKVLLAGGTNGSVASVTAEIYDPGARTFTATGSMTNGRRDFTAFRLSVGKVIVVGGHNGSSFSSGLSQAELFEPTTGSWTTTSPIPSDRILAAGTLTADGKVLVSGGYNVGGSTVTSSASLFDPATAAWTSAGTMPARRMMHTMTLLANGGVLVTGGVQADREGATTSTSTRYSTSEVWAGNAFYGTSGTTALAMSVPRFAHTATLLDDGAVLITGGNGALGPLVTAELFELSTNGQACSVKEMCKSGACVDGVCCSTDCTGTCMACSNALTGAAEGTCAPVKAATDPKKSCKDDGAVTCGANGLCNGAGACSNYPATPCAPQACATGADCTSGYCFDGICCNTSCSGTCRACTAAKKGGGVDGVCEPIKDGTDPDAECGVMGTGLCQSDGVCNGSGACRVTTVGTTCAAKTCSGTAASNEGSTCSNTGSCVASMVVQCRPYLCDATTGGCKTSCSADTDCTLGLKCTEGVCTGKANGATCGTGTECTSGFCADGVCCNTTCSGQCEACDVAGAVGTCSAVTGAPHGTKTACSGTLGDVCAGRCDGVRRTSCTWPATETTCASSCSGSSVTERKCSGGGSCGSTRTRSCTPYICDVGGSGCLTTCTTNAQCSTGNKCVSGSCTVPNVNAVCDGNSKLTNPDATTVECFPFKCSGNACRSSCTSTTQCATGALCDTKTNQCIGGNPQSSSDGCFGCAMPSRASTADRIALGAFVAALLGATVSRRRRAAR